MRVGGLKKPVPTPATVKPVTARKDATVKQAIESVYGFIPDFSQPLADLGRSSTLLYGQRKIGKTAVAAEFPQSVFFMCEPGGEGLSIRQWEIASWANMLKAVRTLEKHPKEFTAVIDTADKAYDMAYAYMMEKLGIKAPPKDDYGNTWRQIKQEFTDVMTRIMVAARGTIFISHADVGEFNMVALDEEGVLLNEGTTNKIVPTMPKQARGFVVGTVSSILYFGYYGEQRYVTLQASDILEAGTRLKEHFWVAGKKKVERVHSIPMGNGPDEAYENLMRAFNNQQEDSGRPQSRAAVGAQPAKRLGRK